MFRKICHFYRYVPHNWDRNLPSTSASNLFQSLCQQSYSKYITSFSIKRFKTKLNKVFSGIKKSSLDIFEPARYLRSTTPSPWLSSPSWPAYGIITLADGPLMPVEELGNLHIPPPAITQHHFFYNLSG
jgi:hypothetical protein